MDLKCPICGGDLPPDELIVLSEQHIVQRFGHRVKLTHQQMVVLDSLIAAWPSLVSYNTLLCRLYDYGEREPDSAMSCLAILVTQLRKALRPLGMRIASTSGSGYTLTKQWKARRPDRLLRRGKR